MGIDFTWRRVAGGDLDGLDVEELIELMVSPFDSGYAGLHAAGRLVSMDDSGAVIGALLGMGGVGGDPFLELPDDWDDEYGIGTIGPDGVREIASAFAAAQWRTWLTQHFDRLMAEAEEAGFASAVEGAAPEGRWADHLIRYAGELTRLFQAAAAEGETVILSIDG